MKNTTKTRGRSTTRSASTGNNGGKAPRGTNIVHKAWISALDELPASSQFEVAKAQIAKAREHLSTLKAAAKAEQSAEAAPKRGRPKSTRSTANKSGIKRGAKSGSTRKASTRRSTRSSSRGATETAMIPMGSEGGTITTQDGLVN